MVVVFRSNLLNRPISMNIKELQSRIRELQGEKLTLHSQGAVIYSGWIDSLTKGDRTYYRLRTHRGQGLTPGCKTIKPGDIEETQKAIERGKQLIAIESQIEQCKSNLARKREQLKRLVG